MEPLDMRMVALTAMTRRRLAMVGQIIRYRAYFSSTQSTSVQTKNWLLTTLTPALEASALVPPFTLSTTVRRLKMGLSLLVLYRPLNGLVLIFST